jgi:O-acetyl-ADP-ribose deacetylase (regulator of RNase III)
MATIEDCAGDLLEADTDALVNTVNCVGVMGKGLALAFKYRYPENYKDYVRACLDGEVKLGHIFFHYLKVHDRWLTKPRYILNFPTKNHWRNPSQIHWIRDGLVDLVRCIKLVRIESIAVPALGCKNGGLNWANVRPMIVDALQPLPGLLVKLYGPQ